MTSSAPCKSSARRNELVKLFWKARVMQAFRDGRGHAFLIPERWDAKRLADYLFADLEPVSYFRDTYPTVIFTFDGATCGDQLFLFVTAEGLLIVPPFPYTNGRSDIPLFPEELTCSASR